MQLTLKKSTALLGICCILPALIILGIVAWGKQGGDTSAGKPPKEDALPGQAIPILERTHVPQGTKVDYNSNPPTSGSHWPEPAAWGFYGYRLHDSQLVHNLEHGGIWISFKDVDEQIQAKLKAIAGKYPQAVIVTQRPQNDSRIAVASWGRLATLDTLDEAFIERFIRANLNNSPEPLASLEPLAIRVGVPFPAFSLKEVDGRQITNDTLKSTPAIIWFTTSWCVPCQIGARDVSRLDNELGGKAFNVLVVFVDSKETNAALVNWRQQFANPDWMVGFDPPMVNLAKKVNLRFLDSKFLLDKAGLIQNIDVEIADEQYLSEIKRIVNTKVIE